MTDDRRHQNIYQAHTNMSEDGYPRSSYDNPDRDGSDVGHSSRHGHNAPPRIPHTVQHYIPSSESLDRLGPSGAPLTPTKSKAKSPSPHRRSSNESASQPQFANAGSGSGSGSGHGGRWRDSAMPGAATQSELGHGYAGAPPRVSIESEGGASATMSVGDGDVASATDMVTLVEPSFDENILRSLCETDVSVYSWMCRSPIDEQLLVAAPMIVCRW